MGIVIKVAEDRYLEWSNVVDAPVSWVYSRAAAQAQFGAERVRRADERGTSVQDAAPVDGAAFVRFNRAGPNEKCITVEAMLERYASQAAYDAFELTPAKVHPYTLEDVDGSVWWVPWKPGNAPAQLPENFFTRALREPFEAGESA